MNLFNEIIELIKFFWNDKGKEFYGFDFIKGIENVGKGKQGIIDMAYRIGKQYMLDYAMNPKVKIDNIEPNRKKLTIYESSALDYLKTKGFLNITNLFSKTSRDILASLESMGTDPDKEILDSLYNIFEEKIKDNESRGKIEATLREVVGQKQRDWARVVTTETQDAVLNGQAGVIIQDKNLYPKGIKTKVYKITRPDACPYCIRLYGKQPPRIFTLEELIENGTNIGVPREAWQPVVGVMHPNCQCQLQVLPEGFVLGDTGELILEDI